MSNPPLKRKRSAWFAFYPDDYCGGTRTLSLAARGAFIDLLAYQFANGSIPNDDRTICRIIGAFPDEWEPIKGEVLGKFEMNESGALINFRMEKERLEREGIREKRSESGKAGNAKRWKDDRKCDPICDTFATDLRIASTSTSTTTTKSSTEIEPKGSIADKPAKGKTDRLKAKPQSRDEFDQFFKSEGLYPRDSEYAWLHWEENGWTNGKAKIKDWKATVRKWKAGGYFPTQKQKYDSETKWTDKPQGPEWSREPSGNWRDVWFELESNPDEKFNMRGERYRPNWRDLNPEMRQAIHRKLEA